MPTEHPSPTDLAVRLEDVASVVAGAMNAALGMTSSPLMVAPADDIPFAASGEIHALYAEALDRVTRERDEARADVNAAHALGRFLLEKAEAASLEREGKMEALVKELADDLEAEIQARAGNDLPRRIERDMEPVRRARTALNTNGEK